MVFEEVGILEKLLRGARGGVEKEIMLRDVALPAVTIEAYLELLSQAKFITREKKTNSYSLTGKGMRCLEVLGELSEAYFRGGGRAGTDSGEAKGKTIRWNKEEIIEKMKDIIQP